MTKQDGRDPGGPPVYAALAVFVILSVAAALFSLGLQIEAWFR